MTVFGNKVAVTSCVEQIQYVLEWEGDSTMGKKLNAFLTTLKKGEAPVKIKLTGLEILDIREQCYFITFSVDNKIGELVFIWRDANVDNTLVKNCWSIVIEFA